jgi:hypothetical protein
VKLDLATELDCSAEAAWEAVQTSALWVRIAWPLARLVPTAPAIWPERWREGLTIRGRLYILGFVPVGTHSVHIERVDHRHYEIQSRESDPLAKTWDHLIAIRPLGEDRSTYRDTIDIDAGALTFVVWAWAAWFYRHRQRRWRAIAPSLGAKTG